MSIAYFGGDGPEVFVQNAEELFEAIDLLHTQVIDNFPDKIAAPYLEVLEKAMEALDALGVVRL